ncbi:MAG TPA: hypothetical protein VNO34_10295 [Actinomycetota bacterium]|nr:hypothetical protein [Actinomycetota bacterium]
MLLVEQDVLRAFNIAQRSYVLSQGRVVKAGPCQELAVDPEVQRICLGA